MPLTPPPRGTAGIALMCKYVCWSQLMAFYVWIIRVGGDSENLSSHADFFFFSLFLFNSSFVFSCFTFVSCLHIGADYYYYYCGCSTWCEWNVYMSLVALTSRFYHWSFCSSLTTYLFFLYSSNHSLSVDCGCVCIQAQVWPPRVCPWPPYQVDWQINTQCVLLSLRAFTVALWCDQVLSHYTVTEKKHILIPCVEKKSIPVSSQQSGPFFQPLVLAVILLKSSYCSSCASN